HPEKVRRELAKANHIIVTDNLTECAGKYYTIISTELNCDYKENLDDEQILYGKFYETDPVFAKRTREEIATMKGILEIHKSSALEEKIARYEAILEKVKA
ncbi:MAG: tRNA (adenine(22)-N(1))-methyltransferase TrmK, partial [Clostridia bacterium]|nr:tRNA (adenine(22)-N(1))-methyltransferase TrmK [Clostridia bacterium]